MQQISAPFAGVRELAASYWNATELGPVDTHCVRIGGHVIELRFGTPGLVKCIMPAFAHLRIGPGLASELVVDIWDSASTGACPPPIFDVDRDAPAGALYFFEDESMRGVFQPGMRALSAVDFATDHAWYFVEDPAALPYWERAA